jgi:hypothetical protein
MEVKIPLKLKDFQVVSDNTTKEEVKSNLKAMLDFIYKEEKAVFESSNKFFNICTYIRNNKKQQANSMGRYMGLNTSVEYPYQNYNINEIFRSVTIDKCYGYIQSANIFRILNDYESRDYKEIKKIYKERYITKAPKDQVIKAHIHRFFEKGQVVASRPNGAREFNTSQADMYFCTKPEIKDGNIFITIKLSKGEITLKFRIPESQRFTEGFKKYSRPNIVIENEQLVFIFTVFKEVEEKEYKNLLGVDIGKVESFVATSVYVDEKKYSAPFYATKDVNVLTKRIDGLFKEIKRIDNKIAINERCNHPEKVEILKVDRQRKRNKISKLKDKRAELQARAVVKIADRTKSAIVIEELNWSDKSGKWERSIIQEKTKNLAKANGVEVFEINPKDTSKKCWKCDKKISYNSKTRQIKCKRCETKVDRDVLASRNIVKKKNKEIFKSALKQRDDKAAQIRGLYAGSLYDKGNLEVKPVENPSNVVKMKALHRSVSSFNKS